MREFAVPMVSSTIVGANTLVFINPPAAPSVNIQLLRATVGQAANATSAQQRVQHVSQVTAFPTLTSVTPQKLKRSDPNASVITGGTAGAAGTCGVNASAEGAGAKTVMWEETFNVLNGYLWVPTPPEVVVFNAGLASGYGLFFPAAPATLTSWAANVNFAEV